MIKKVFFYSLLFLVVSCKQKNAFFVIDIHQGSLEQAGISEVAENVMAIPLETTPECLLNYIFPAKDDTLLFILSNDQVYLFGMSGKFHKTLTNKGKGPGEVSIILSFDIDRINKELLVFGIDGRFIRYTYDGTVISQMTMKRYPYYDISQFAYYDDNIYAVAMRTSDKDNYKKNDMWLLRFDKSMNLHDSIMLYRPNLSPSSTLYGGQIGLSVVDNQLLISTTGNSRDRDMRDTLYLLTDKTHRVPVLRLNYGYQADANGYPVNISPILKNRRFLFTTYSNRGNGSKDFHTYTFCYDFGTGQKYHLKDGFDDDIYHTGKVNLWHIDVFNNEYYFYKSSDELSQSFPKRTEEDNPVLFTVTLKQ